MASSSPFGCNPKKSVFGAKPVLDKQAAPEPVLLLVDKSQVITAMIPYNSKNAPLVRAHMHEHIQHEGRKIFIFRAVNGWTNIDLASTAETPKLTCDPITALKTAWAAFAACPHVGKLTIRWKGEDKELKFEDIDGMEGQFDALPEGTPASSDPSMDKKTDAEYLMDKLNEIDKKVDDKILELGKKIDEVAGQMMSEFGEKMVSLNGQMDELISLIYRDADAPIRSVQTPTTESRLSKRRARKGGEASASLDLA